MRALVVVCLALGGCLPASSGTTSTTGTTGGTTGGTPPGVDAHMQHNLDVLNMYRAQHQVGPLALDGALDAFALTGSQQHAAGGPAHGHFMQAAQDGTLWTSGFCNGAAENQAPATAPGWDVSSGEDAAIDAILAAMMGEGPSGGHYQNIVNGSYTRVGVGLVLSNGLWLTNDFSSPCN